MHQARRISPLTILYSERRGESVSCRTCGVAGHMQCLGLKRERHWRKIVWDCELCLHKLPQSAANCACCPAPSGLLYEVWAPACTTRFRRTVRGRRTTRQSSCSRGLQVVDLGRHVPDAHRTHNKVFVHIADALWTPELAQIAIAGQTGVSLRKLTGARMALQCTFCGQGGGAVMCALASKQCFHISCFVHNWHSRCMRRGLSLFVWFGADNAAKTTAAVLSTCCAHIRQAATALWWRTSSQLPSVSNIAHVLPIAVELMRGSVTSLLRLGCRANLNPPLVFVGLVVVHLLVTDSNPA